MQSYPHPSSSIRNVRFCWMLSVCLVAQWTSVATAQPEPLRWKFAVGDRFRVVSEQSETSKTKVDTRNTQLDSNLLIEFDWEVEQVEPSGVATIRQSIKRLRAQVGNPAVPSQAIEYDTDSTERFSKASRKLLKQVEPLVGLAFSFKMEPAGKIRDVQFSPAATETLNRLPESMGLKALFSESGLQKLLGDASVTLPEDGQSAWTAVSKVESAFGELTRRLSFQLEEAPTGSPAAEISVKAAVDELADGNSIKAVSPSNPTADPGSLNRFDGNGKLTFDRQAGNLQSSDVTYFIESSREYREKTISTQIESRLQVTFSRIEEAN